MRAAVARQRLAGVLLSACRCKFLGEVCFFESGVLIERASRARFGRAYARKPTCAASMPAHGFTDW